MLVRGIVNNERSGSREWIFGRGLNSYRKENQAVSQRIKSGLLEFINDCYFALNNGIDWYMRLGYTGQKQALDDDIVKMINNNESVISIENYESTLTDRIFNAKCLIYTIYSETPINFSLNQGNII